MNYEYWKKHIYIGKHLEELRSTILTDRNLTQEEVDRLMELIKEN